MKFLSHVLEQGMPLYGNSNNLFLEQVRGICSGDSSNNTEISLPAHSGTHVDAPYHFDQSGMCIEEYPPNFWVCKQVHVININVNKEEIISLDKISSELSNMPNSTEFLIIKTGFEKFRDEDKEKYILNGPGLSPDVGVWLRNNKSLKMIGFDFISLSSYAHRELGREAHKAFLCKRYLGFNKQCSNPILIVEDMHLMDLDECPDSLYVFPLRYKKSDGAPVTIYAY